MNIQKLIKAARGRNRPLIMGVLNVTPDSFSDGGRYFSLKGAVSKAREMKKNGVDIIDIGGESTGPKSKYVPLKEEIARVIPVIKAIRKISNIPISVDTYKAEVALQALRAGADLVNDVTAMRGDKKMVKVIAEAACPVVMMYSKDNTPRTTVKKKKYADVVGTIDKFFKERIKYAVSRGVSASKIIIDPGMGQFISAYPQYSFEIIARLSEFKKFKLPILVGLSRKSFLGGKMMERDSMVKPLTAIAYLNGAAIIRTHDVKGVKNYFDHLCQI